MKTKQWLQSFVAFAVVALVAAGCANQMEPAKKAIADIEAAVAAAGDDATKYIPDEVQRGQRQGCEPQGAVRQEGLQGRGRRGPGGTGAGAGAGSQRSRQEDRDRWMRERGSGASLAASFRRPSPRSRAASTYCRSRRSCLPGWTRRRSTSIKTGLAEANSMWTQATAGPVVGRPGAGGRPWRADQDAHGRAC